MTSQVVTATARADSSAQALFARFQSLAAAYDVAIADLYCDDAVIGNTRIYPWGQRRHVELSAQQYRDLIASVMPLAKARGDHSTYSNVTYTAEGDRVLIVATRQSALKNYTSAFSQVVGPCAGRDWAIIREQSESRP